MGWGGVGYSYSEENKGGKLCWKIPVPLVCLDAAAICGFTLVPNDRGMHL